MESNDTKSLTLVLCWVFTESDSVASFMTWLRISHPFAGSSDSNLFDKSWQQVWLKKQCESERKRSTY